MASESTTPDRRLTLDTLRWHFTGIDPGFLIGAAITSQEGTCKWGLIDIDRHMESTNPETNWKYAQLIWSRIKQLGFNPLLLDSNGFGGYHILFLFAEPRPHADVYAFLQWCIRDQKDHALGEPPETFPKQAIIREGTWVRLPGLHHTKTHYTSAWDNTDQYWLDAADTIKQLITQPPDLTPFPPEALIWAQQRKPTIVPSTRGRQKEPDLGRAKK